MNWRGFAVRITLVAVALPVIGVFVFLLPWRSHLAFNVLVAAVSVIGSIEVVGLFGARRIPVSRFLAPVLAGTLPVAAYLQTAGIVPPGIELHLLSTAAVAGIILVARHHLPAQRPRCGRCSPMRAPRCSPCCTRPSSSPSSRA